MDQTDLFVTAPSFQIIDFIVQKNDSPSFISLRSAVRPPKKILIMRVGLLVCVCASLFFVAFKAL